VANKDENAETLRGKTHDELSGLLINLRKEQFNLRFQRASGNKEGLGRVKLVRRTIARIKTILTEKRSVAAS
jgi:large subunit ribosomal protein L29